MNFNDYQNEARQTAIYPPKYYIIYPTLGLVGEAGEIANKVKKIYRDSNGELNEDIISTLKSEIGDVLWYCAALASDLGVSLSEIAEDNIAKLKRRHDTNTIQGSGDDREKVAVFLSKLEVDEG